MEVVMEPVGVRQAKNKFSELTALVNQTGTPLTVLKNSKPWVVISPASEESRERREKLSRLHALTASIEASVEDDPVWDKDVSDRELLGEERMRRFG